jgi:hypothetical protein
MDLSERDLDKSVMMFIKERFNVNWAGTNLGKRVRGTWQHTKGGKIDVFGVREWTEGFNNHFEVYGIEVKLGSYHFAKDIGQTLGYSRFCHRLYYAYKEQEAPEEQVIEFASKFGVGVIKIDRDNLKASKLLLNSILFKPDKNLLLRCIDGATYSVDTDTEKLFLEECIICKRIVELWDKRSGRNKAINYDSITKKKKRNVGKSPAETELKPVQIQRDRNGGKQYFTLCMDCRRDFHVWCE